jgi:hypothetical protein
VTEPHDSVPPQDGVPTDGYQVPEPGTPFGGPPVVDPLTPGQYPSFDGWARRTVGVVRRAFRPGLAILAATALLPAAVAGGLGIFLQRYTGRYQGRQQLTQQESYHLLTGLAGYAGLLLVLSALTAYLSSVGWVACLRLMAEQAAGRPTSVGDCLRYGVRRGLPLWGWYLLAELVFMVGLCACVVPGIYLALALSMIAPIVAFEREEPAFTRSFRLVHSNFWPTVGRLLVLFLAVGIFQYLVSCVLGAVTGLGVLSVPAHQPGVVALVVNAVLNALVGLPVMLVEIAGLLVTYAELRGRQEPLTSADLAAAAA